MLIRSAIFEVAFWLWIAIVGGPTLPISIIYRPFVFKVARAWGIGTIWLAKVICGINYEIIGKENIPKYPCIVACKHQSTWDTAILWALLDRPSFVLKKELIFYPIFGWNILLLKSIYIDRKSGASAIKKMLRMAAEKKKQGRQIVIYPEGTRTKPNTKTTYHSGVAAIYQNLQLPVVPVALNSGLFWSRESFIKKSGNIKIEFLPPIDAGLRPRDFLTTLEQNIEDSCRKIS